VHPTENAISAVAKIADVFPTKTNVPELLQFLVPLLPLRNDGVEGRCVHEMLCGFIEKYPTVVLGEGLANAPKIVAIFAEIVDTRFMSAASAPRIAAIVRHLTSQLPATAFASIPQEHATRL
jgi:hypothetical protein